MIEIPRHRRKAYLRNCRILAVLSTIMAAIYLKWLLFDALPDNHTLYWILVAAECFNIAQSAGFWVTISRQKWSEPEKPDFANSIESVDLFVTVLGEPIEIVEQTVAAATRVRHPNLSVWILDDGKSPRVRALADRHHVGYLTRENLRGAKAGNMNHALARTRGDFIAIFDADQVPHPDFLEATLGGFEDLAIAFVQTPQTYRNSHENRVAAGADNQQMLFYGPILRGKNGSDAVFSCGTNVVFRRSAIKAIGGFPEDSITEDLRASILLIDKGYTSMYVSKVLAEGLGPLDVNSYFNQQFRWGRGGLEILFKRSPFSRKMSTAQGFQYSLGFMYWFTGWAYLAYLALPVLYLVFGLRPVQVPNTYPAHFLPYVFTTLATIVYATDYGLRFDALWFTLASFPVQVKALLTTFSGKSAKFVVTPKGASARSLRPVRWLAIVSVILAGAALYGLATKGLDPSVVNNVAWIIAHLVILQGFIRLAFNPLGSARPARRKQAAPADEPVQ